jgi:hypothetical protein
LIVHLFGSIDAVDQLKKLDPIADAMPVLLPEDNTQMFRSTGMHGNVINIVRAQYASLGPRKAQMIDIALP